MGVDPETQPLCEYREPDPEIPADAPSPLDLQLDEIRRERVRQDVKWGVQDHPLLNPKLVDRGPLVMAHAYEIPNAQRAQRLCQQAAANGEVTWAHILIEEVAEFVGCTPGDVEAMRTELIQIAAVAVAAVDYIDRHHPF